MTRFLTFGFGLSVGALVGGFFLADGHREAANRLRRWRSEGNS